MAMMGRIRRRRFGEILISEKLITQEQVGEALKVQKSSGDSLGRILLDLGYISDGDIVKALSIQYQIPYLSTANYEVDKKLVGKFDPKLLHRHALLPFDKIGNIVLVLATDIPTRQVMSKIQETCECDIAVYLGTATDVEHALQVNAEISREQVDDIKRERALARTVAKDKARRVASKETGEISPEEFELSSESFLSSLDAAWDSIFVDSNGPQGPEES